MTDQSISQQASVAADEGTLKRSIQMKMFASMADKKRVELAYLDEQSPTRGNVEKSSRTVGMIIGAVFDVVPKMGSLPSGESKESLLAVGDFEATNYSTGEVWTSASAYLPRYYLEVAKAAFGKGATRMELAVEIVLVPTGKEIGIAYEVRNIIRRPADSPINRLKLQLQAAGRLPKALPPPMPLTASELEVIDVEVEPAKSEAPADPPAPTETETKGGAKKAA